MSDDACCLVPKRIGTENVSVESGGEEVGRDDPTHSFTAFSGTGFNPENPQHWMGSDGLRYAIAIQQARDDGDFEAADAKRDRASGFGYDVGTAKDRTVVKPKGFKGWQKLK